MIKSFFLSKKWFLWAWGGSFLLILSIWLQVTMSVAINSWYGTFYDLLQNAKNYYEYPSEGIKQLYSQLISFDYLVNRFNGNPSFLVIAFPYIFLAVFTGWFTRIYSLRWREAITFSYIPKWRNIKKDIEGSSQRIQEDCARWSRLIESLGLQVIRAIMTLIAFLPILWSLSKNVEISFLKNLEGSLVWCALFFSLGGLLISWFVGWKLPGLEYNNQKVEAAFRKNLVLGEDDKVNYAQEETLWELFLGVKFNYHKIYLHYGYFDFWISFYDQLMTIVPYLIVAPGLFTGLIQLGTMAQVSNAFSKVHSGFALFLHNWTTITEIRSIWKRLYEFEELVDQQSNTSKFNLA